MVLIVGGVCVCKKCVGGKRELVQSLPLPEDGTGKTDACPPGEYFPLPLFVSITPHGMTPCPCLSVRLFWGKASKAGTAVWKEGRLRKE